MKKWTPEALRYFKNITVEERHKQRILYAIEGIYKSLRSVAELGCDTINIRHADYADVFEELKSEFEGAGFFFWTVEEERNDKLIAISFAKSKESTKTWVGPFPQNIVDKVNKLIVT